MADSDIKTFNELLKADKKIGKEVHLAFDAVLLYALERRHLDLPEFSNILFEPETNDDSSNIYEYLKRNVRLVKIDEISFDSDEKIHLPGVESALTSMRGRGFSLVFIVHGDVSHTSVYLGLSKFAEAPSEINAAVDSYTVAWQANFAGSKLKKLSTEDISIISKDIADCKEFGVLTGIPSLKREEGSNQFVQGLERLGSLGALPRLAAGSGLLLGARQTLERAVVLLVGEHGGVDVALLEDRELDELAQLLAERAHVVAAQVLGRQAVGGEHLLDARQQGLLADAELSTQQLVQIQAVAWDDLRHGPSSGRSAPGARGCELTTLLPIWGGRAFSFANGRVPPP